MNKNIPVSGSKEPFIFISYSHDDRDKVYNILQALKERGFRIWYDQKLEAGDKWTHVIAKNIRRSAVVLALVGENFIDSDFCERELTYAADQKKLITCVFFEKVDEPDWMSFLSSTSQKIFKYDYDTEEAFLEKLFASPSFMPCLKEEEKVQAEVQPKVEDKIEVLGEKNEETGNYVSEKPPRGKRKVFPVLIAAVAALLCFIIVGWLIPALKSNRQDAGVVEQQSSTSEAATENVEQPNSISFTDKIITSDVIDQINTTPNFTVLSFTDCSFEEGVLENLKLDGEGDKSLTFRNAEGLDDLNFLLQRDSYYALVFSGCGLKNEMIPDLSALAIKYLDFSGNEEITAVSVDTENILEINLSDTNAADISFLGSAGSLKRLYLQNTGVSDITPLIPLTELQILNLSGTKVTSFKAELECLGLKEIYLRGCGLESTEGLQDYADLQVVDLGYNSLKDVSFLADIAANLKALYLDGNELNGDSLTWLKNAVSLQKLVLDHIDLSGINLDFAQEMTNLRFLSARDCGIRDISGITNDVSLQHIWLGFNRIEDLTPLTQMKSEYYIDSLDLAQNEVKIVPAMANIINELVLVGNPISSLRHSKEYDLFMDYYDGMEVKMDSSFGRVYAAGCPRNKRQDLSRKIVSIEFVTRAEQLELIQSKMEYISYSGFEDMFLAIPEPEL